MNFKYKILIKGLSVVLLLAFSGELFAQQELSLQQARSMALEKNEQIKIADKQIQKAEEDRKAAFTNYLPKISASATGAYLNDDISQELYIPTVTPDPMTGALNPNVMINPMTGQPVIGPDGNPVFNMYGYLPLDISLKGAYMAGLNVEQPLFTGGKIFYGNQMAKIGEQMAAENRQLKAMDALYEADQAYWMFVSVGEKVKLANQAVEMLEKIVQRVQNSVDAGMATQNDVLKAQVELNKAKLNRQKAQSGLELTRLSLCRVIGIPFNSEITAIDTLVNYDAVLLGGLGNEEVRQRPEYRLMEKQVALKHEAVKFARADFLPTAGISAGVNYLGGVELMGEEYSSNNMSVMAKVNIPLFHWGEGYRKITSAKIEAEMQQLELEKNAQLLILETEQAKLNLKDAYARIVMAEEAMVQAQENVEVSKDNYEAGMEEMTSYLIAQTQWQEAYSELIEAKTDFKVKETVYLKVTGKLQ